MSVIFILGIFVLFVGSFGYNIQPENNVESIEPFAFEDVINATLEKIRPLIPDPLRIANLSIDLPTEGLLVGGAKISNSELTGLQGFQVPFLNLDLGILEGRLNFTFVLPSITLTTDYWTDIVVGDLLPFYGDGKANVHILNATIQGSAQASLFNGIAIKNLRIQLSLESANFDIHGLFYDEDFSSDVSSFLNGIDSFIDNYQELVSDIISPIIKDILNAILSGGGDTTTVEPPTETTPPPTTGAYKLP